jgi:prepilin-type processing-associated H-X9-DG protein
MAGGHAGGVNATYGDGSVHFLTDAVDVRLLRAWATREGGEAVKSAIARNKLDASS